MQPIGINVNVNFLASLVLFLAARPNRKELLVMCAAGAALGANLGLHGGMIERALLALSYCGAGSLLAVFLMPFTRHEPNLKLLGKLAIPPAFGAVSAGLLGLGALGITYDHFLYAFDGSLGYQPSYLAGQAIAVAPWIGWITKALYDALPLLVTSAYILVERRNNKEARDLFFLLMAIGVCGALCFIVFPAVGAYFLFARTFPHHPPDLSTIAIVPTMVAAKVPRNCMPSLHTAWALAVIWTAARFGRPWRLALRGLLAVMLVQTLVYHYLADMMVSFPFTLALYAATRSTVPWAARERRNAVVFGAALVALWMIAFRWATPVFLASPLAPWIALLATVGWSCRAWWLLERAADRRACNDSVAGNQWEGARLDTCEATPSLQ